MKRKFSFYFVALVVMFSVATMLTGYFKLTSLTKTLSAFADEVVNECDSDFDCLLKELSVEYRTRLEEIKSNGIKRVEFLKDEATGGEYSKLINKLTECRKNLKDQKFAARNDKNIGILVDELKAIVNDSQVNNDLKNIKIKAKLDEIAKLKLTYFEKRQATKDELNNIKAEIEKLFSDNNESLNTQIAEVVSIVTSEVKCLTLEFFAKRNALCLAFEREINNNKKMPFNWQK